MSNDNDDTDDDDFEIPPTEPTQEFEYKQLTIRCRASKLAGAKELIDCITSEDKLGPVLDKARAAKLLDYDDPDQVPPFPRALREVGAQWINDEMMECRRLAEMPAAADIEVVAFIGLGSNGETVTLRKLLDKAQEGYDRSHARSGPSLSKRVTRHVPHPRFDTDHDNITVAKRSTVSDQKDILRFARRKLGVRKQRLPKRKW